MTLGSGHRSPLHRSLLRAKSPMPGATSVPGSGLLTRRRTEVSAPHVGLFDAPPRDTVWACDPSVMCDTGGIDDICRRRVRSLDDVLACPSPAGGGTIRFGSSGSRKEYR